MRTTPILKVILATILVAGLTSIASANVWVYEDFDNTIAAPFSQGDATTAPPVGTIDYFDDDDVVAIPTLPLLTHTGAIVTTKSFNSSAASYELDPGETFACADGYDGSGHGSTIYFQYAINVDPIPAGAGPIARFEYNTTLASIAYRVFVNLDADGTGKVNITGGQDLATTWTATLPIATLNSSSEWAFLTVQISNDAGAANDPRSPITPLSPGIRFYSSSLTPAATVAIPGGTAKDGGPWSLTVNASTTAKVYIDKFYWEGGMEDSSVIGESELEPFNYPSAVVDWPLLK